MSAATRERALPGVLLFIVMVTGIISSLGAPLIPSVSDDLGVCLGAAQWSLTATLLTGVISSPVMGRLADGPRRREVLLGGLVVVAAGSVIAALAASLPVLLVGRAMQGVGLGLVPLGMATARDAMPGEKVAGTIGLLSVGGAAGAGAGYPISGLLAGIGLSAAFWFGAVVAVVALVLGFLFVPPTSAPHRPKLDSLGALLLTAGLSALLIAISEGSGWGWGAAQTVGLFAFAAVAFFLWGLQQLRVDEPLVDLRLARHPAVLTGDIVAAVLGIALYMYLSGVTEFVQAPSAIGYGFSASVVVAGLCLVPFSVVGIFGSRALPLANRLLGGRNLLSAGALTGRRRGALRDLSRPPLERLRDDGPARRGLRPHLRGDPGDDRPRRAGERDRVGDRLLPGGPLRRLLDRQRAGGLGARLGDPGRQPPATRGGLREDRLDRGLDLRRRRAPRLGPARPRRGRGRARPRRAAPPGGGRRAGERRPPGHRRQVDASARVLPAFPALSVRS